MDSIAAKDNAEALAEMVVMEQLLNNMPVELQVWIRQRKPKTVEEAATQADDYVLACQRMKKALPSSSSGRQDAMNVESWGMLVRMC